MAERSAVETARLSRSGRNEAQSAVPERFLVQMPAHQRMPAWKSGRGDLNPHLENALCGVGACFGGFWRCGCVVCCFDGGRKDERREGCGCVVRVVGVFGGVLLCVGMF